MSEKQNGLHDPALAIVFDFMNRSRDCAFIHKSVEKSKSVSCRGSPQLENECRWSGVMIFQVKKGQ